MHVISKRRISEFCERHPEAETALLRWYQIVRKQTWNSFADVRAMFRSADQYHHCLVFNVGGNKYRIIAAIHYNTHRIYIRHVLTHADYDQDSWKAECE